MTIECFEREQIDDACIKEGQHRYAQSYNTPFLTNSLIEVQYADFQEVQEALAPVYDSGLNL
jgi:hypothetical protein